MGMNTYEDGTMGEIVEGDSVSDIHKKLLEEADSLDKAIREQHITTDRRQLEEKKLTQGNAKRIMSKLDQLERRINRIIVHLEIETPDEILVVD